MNNNQIFISILLAIAILLYYFGYDICHLLYNQYDYVGEEKKRVARQFWDLRFSNYSVIIAIVFYVHRFKLNSINKSIAKIGFNLAFISAVDKLIFKTFDFSKLDIYIFIILICWEVYQHIKSKNNELYKRVSIQ